MDMYFLHVLFTDARPYAAMTINMEIPLMVLPLCIVNEAPCYHFSQNKTKKNKKTKQKTKQKINHTLGRPNTIKGPGKAVHWGTTYTTTRRNKRLNGP